MVFLLALLALGYLVTRKKGHTRAAVIVVSFACLYAASIAPSANALCFLLERDSFTAVKSPDRQLDAVVVLAGGVAGNRYLDADTLNRQSAIRLVRAVEVFHSSGAQYLVCSGSTEFFDEAGIMARTVSRLGVPAASVRIDVKSRNTREHAIEVSKMFGDRPIRLGLVTSAYHMPRSLYEFRKYFPDVVSYPTDFLYSYRRFSIFALVPSSAHLNTLSTALSELVGIGWSRVRDTL